MGNPMLNTRDLRYTDFTGGTPECLDFATHTDDSSLYYAPVGSRAEVWKNGQVYQYFLEDTGAVADGLNVIQSVVGGYTGTLRWRLYGVTGAEETSIILPVTSYPDGISDLEIWSYALPANKHCVIKRVSIRRSANAGPVTGLSIEVAETTDFVTFTTLYSTNDAADSFFPEGIAESSPGTIIVLRITNLSGAVQDASILAFMGII